MTKTALVYIAAAIAEIAGCFGIWLWLRHEKSIWLLPASLAYLAMFAVLLTMVETNAAGRAYAAYGGVYIVASVFWLWQVENIRPDRWDLIGATLCLFGATIILLGPRGPAI